MLRAVSGVQLLAPILQSEDGFVKSAKPRIKFIPHIILYKEPVDIRQ
jgi:hypothetical protein